MPGMAETPQAMTAAASEKHVLATPIFQQHAQPVRVYVPRAMKPQVRAQVCRMVKLHGGKVEAAKLDNSNIVIFDLDHALTSRNTYRAACTRDTPLPVVPASWILDSIQAGQMCDPALPKYDPIARLEDYQRQDQDAQAAAQSGAAQQAKQAQTAALVAQAEAEQTKKRTAINA